MTTEVAERLKPGQLPPPVDVFGSDHKAYQIPPDAPVLPSMASRGNVELVVKDDGSALVLYNFEMEQKVHWVEYDMDLDLLTFVTWNGMVFGLGLKIHGPFQKHLRLGNSIYMIFMKDGETPSEIDNVVMIVRRIGL